MYIRPIPKHLLPHTVEYLEKIPDDGFSDNMYKDPVSLRNVFVAPKKGELGGMMASRDTLSDTVIYNYVLFYDLNNSSSDKEFEFKKDSKVIMDNIEFIVKDVKPVFGTKLHHYKVMLS